MQGWGEPAGQHLRRWERMGSSTKRGTRQPIITRRALEKVRTNWFVVLVWWDKGAVAWWLLGALENKGDRGRRCEERWYKILILVSANRRLVRERRRIARQWGMSIWGLWLWNRVTPLCCTTDVPQSQVHHALWPQPAFVQTVSIVRNTLSPSHSLFFMLQASLPPLMWTTYFSSYPDIYSFIDSTHLPLVKTWLDDHSE